MLGLLLLLAQDPWASGFLESAPADVLSAARAEKAEEGESTLLLWRETRYALEAGGKAQATYRTAYRVLNEEGVQAGSTVRAQWAPWYQERPVVRARVVTADGKAHPLAPDTLTEKPVADPDAQIFSDRRVLVGPLPAVATGAVVEVEILVRDSRPFFEKGMVRYEHFGGGLASRRERLRIDAPDGLEIKHLARLLPGLEPRREAEGGRVRLTWEAGPFKPREPGEPLSPGDVPQSSYVAFTTGRSWKEIATAYHQVVETQIAAADLAGLGPAAEGPPEGRVARALARLQEKIRYTSLAFGEASIVPRAPGETLKRGYGDCKDKAALLVAALRKEGVTAHVALLFTGPGPDIEAELPGFGVFDHAIVRVQGPPEVWIDPTDKFARPGELPPQDQGRLALVAAPETEGLTRIPASTSRDNVEAKTREVRLSDYGPASFTEVFHSKGYFERVLRGRLDQDRKAVREMLEGYAGEVFAAPKLGAFSHGEPGDLTKPFELRLEAPGAGRGQTDLREAVVAVPLRGLWSELPRFLQVPEKTPRTHDVLFFVPFSSEWRYVVHPPPGFEARALPKSETLSFGPASLGKEYARRADGAVEAVFRFDVGKSRWTPQDVTKARQAYAKAAREGMILIGFTQKGQALLEAGKIREAVAEFRRLAAARPEMALHAAQIARALLDGGLGDAARREARKAVEIDPASPVARQTLAWVLTHDLLGRRFRKGWDVEGAEAALRAALKLKPDEADTALDLAITLEHDAAGRRYVPGPRLDEAITLYKSVSEKTAGTGFEFNLSFALLWAGRFEDLAELQRGTKAQMGLITLLVARAVLEGSGAALTMANNDIAGDDARRACLSEAGNLLLKLRHYEPAGELLAAAARGAPQAANLLARADRIRKAKRWEDPKDEPGPEGVVRRVLYRSLVLPFDAKAFRPLLSEHLVQDSTDEEWSAAFKVIHDMASENLLRQGLPLETVRDLTLSLSELAVEGDAATGWKVSVPMITGAGARTWYLSREDGEIRLVGSGSHDLGRFALVLAEAGESDRAKAWLERAAEEEGEPAARNPLDADPFQLLWKKGMPADARQILRAAAALAADKRAIPILDRERKETEDKTIGFALDHALARALLREKRPQEALKAAERMWTADAESLSATFTLQLAYRQLRMFDELIKLSEDRLKKKPDDLMALYDLQHQEMWRGNYAASVAWAKRLIKIGQASDEVYNNLAWTLLLDGTSTEEALRHAQKAVMDSRGRKDHSLHTLATVYADLGRPAEARDVLLQTFEARPNAEPESHDWYVLGRIAEEYGAREAAVEAYRKTAADKDAELPNSTNRLSLRRLKLLEKK